MERDGKFDLLRMVSCLMVVLIHVSAPYVTENMDSLNLNFTIGNFYDSIARVCVPVFVMLSGAFILDNHKNRNYIFFYRKTYNKIVIPTIIWSVLYFLFNLMILTYKSCIGIEVDYWIPLIDWIDGRPYYHLWYLYMIIGLYLITPFLIIVKDEIGEISFFKLGCILTFLGFIISITSDLFWPIKFINYLGYFCLGYSIRKKGVVNFKKSLVFLLCWLITAIGIFVLTQFIIANGQKDENSLYFYDNLSPLVLIGSILMFSSFAYMREIKLWSLINRMTKHSFNIYILHAGILAVVNMIEGSLLKVECNLVWYIPLKAFLVFIVSYGASILITRIFNLFSSYLFIGNN